MVREAESRSSRGNRPSRSSAKGSRGSTSSRHSVKSDHTFEKFGASEPLDDFFMIAKEMSERSEEISEGGSIHEILGLTSSSEDDFLSGSSEDLSPFDRETKQESSELKTSEDLGTSLEAEDLNILSPSPGVNQESSELKTSEDLGTSLEAEDLNILSPSPEVNQEIKIESIPSKSKNKRESKSYRTSSRPERRSRRSQAELSSREIKSERIPSRSERTSSNSSSKSKRESSESKSYRTSSRSERRSRRSERTSSNSSSKNERESISPEVDLEGQSPPDAPKKEKRIKDGVDEKELLEFLLENVGKGARHPFYTKGVRTQVINLDIIWKKILTTKFDSMVGLFEGKSINGYSPFSAVLTLDWKMAEDYGVSEFNDEFKAGLISCFQEGIKKILGTHELFDIQFLNCCLVQYNPNAARKVNTGIVQTALRISFPHLVVDSRVQRSIFDEAVARCRKVNLLKFLSDIPVSTDLLNRFILLHDQHLQVLLHTCSPQYEFYSHVNPELNLIRYKIPINEVFTRSDLNFAERLEMPLEEMLPLLLSRSYGKRIGITYQAPVRSLDISKVGHGVDYTREKDEYELANMFLDMISPDRYFCLNYFIDIGRSLYRIYRGGDEGQTIWFERAQAVIDEASLHGQLGNIPEHLLNLDSFSHDYYAFGNHDLGMDVRTLAWYAMKDSFDDYSDWQDMWVLNAIEKLVEDKTHEAVGEAFYRINWLTLLTCPIPGNSSVHWFSHQDSIWKESANRSCIINQFTRDIIRRLEILRSRLKANLRPDDDDDDRDRDEQDDQDDVSKEYIKNLNKIIKSCGTAGFMSGVFTFAAAKLQVEDFFKFKNMNLNLTAMNNGVVETSYTAKTIVFREGKPQDYLTLSTNRRLPTHYTWYSPEVRTYNKWIKQVYHTPDLIRHIHKLFASGYIGGNLDKIIIFMLGDGNNSKTTIIRALDAAWGDYMSMIPFTVLTDQPPNPANPNPLAFLSSGPRWLVCTEPSDEDKPFLAGNLKGKSGNDIETARYCHGNVMYKIIPTAIIIAVLNKMLPMSGFGTAIRNRVKPVTHDTTYSHQAPKDKLTQRSIRTYPIDKNFIDNVKNLAEAHLWTELQYFIPYVEDGLDDPPEIATAITDYWEKTDFYMRYMYERLEKVCDVIDGVEIPDKDAKVSVDLVYRDFQAWYGINYPNARIPNVSNFGHYMIEHIGRAFDKHWIGIRLVDNSEEYESGDDNNDD